PFCLVSGRWAPKSTPGCAKHLHAIAMLSIAERVRADKRGQIDWPASLALCIQYAHNAHVDITWAPQKAAENHGLMLLPLLMPRRSLMIRAPSPLPIQNMTNNALSPSERT